MARPAGHVSAWDWRVYERVCGPGGGRGPPVHGGPGPNGRCVRARRHRELVRRRHCRLRRAHRGGAAGHGWAQRGHRRVAREHANAMRAAVVTGRGQAARFTLRERVGADGVLRRVRPRDRNVERGREEVWRVPHLAAKLGEQSSSPERPRRWRSTRADRPRAAAMAAARPEHGVAAAVP